MCRRVSSGIALLCAGVMLAPEASASMVGLVLSVHQSGSFTLIDVYAGVNDPANYGFAVTGNSITTNNSGGFRQGTTPLQKGWSPDVDALTSTTESLDSFCTLGRVWNGSTWAAPETVAPLVFPSGTWAGTGSGAPVTTFPAGGSWYGGPSEYLNQMAVGLNGLTGRMDGETLGGAAPAQYGVWVMHLVLATTAPRTVNIDMSVTWRSIYPVSDQATDRITGSFLVPAPGGAILLLPTMLGLRRRRSHG